MFSVRLKALLVAMFLLMVSTGYAKSKRITPKSPVYTPQDVLLLFSGDTPDQRILLTLNNNRNGALTTTMTAYTVQGNATVLPDVQLVPGESKEVIEDIYTNVGATSNVADSISNANGVFQDQLALLGASALPSNTCIVSKQTFSVNKVTIRVNCLKYTATDVTYSDITGSPNSCSQPC